MVSLVRFTQYDVSTRTYLFEVMVKLAVHCQHNICHTDNFAITSKRYVYVHVVSYQWKIEFTQMNVNQFLGINTDTHYIDAFYIQILSSHHIIHYLPLI